MTLEEYRKAHGITLTAFARMVGVAHSTVLRWETKESLPSRWRMERIQAVTGGAVQPNDFWQGAAPTRQLEVA